MSARPTLEVPADRLVVDGDRIIVVALPGVEMADNDLMSPTMTYFEPPPELVALNQPCPTCDGDGISEDYVPTGRGRPNGIGLCPDCHGSGRLVFDLKTPCDGCNGFGYHVGSIMTPNDCYRCRRQGTVTHRVWLDPEWGIHELPDNGIVAWASDTLPSAARPGDYVVRLVIGGSHE